MVELIVVLLGLVVGSFLNVCILRIPGGESVVLPPSHCRSCGTPIRWYDNLPVVSYLLLRGRCRSCKQRISPRYAIVEVLTAAFAILLFRAGFGPRELFLFCAFVSAMIVVSFIDIDHRIIPDVITLPSLIVAPAAAFIIGHITVVESLIGIAVGGGILWGIAWLYLLIRRQEGMGFGDVKLLAMIGAIQGWEAAIFALIIGSLAGTIVGLSLMIAKRGRLDLEIPFGPFLASGAVLYLFGGPDLIGWYLEGAGIV